ncbi:MAG: glycosyltransferase family A protein [Kiritimatiellia bacterium]
MSRARVSVLIPCYQHGRYLGAALESVFRQTLPEVEAIVVNDGSTDNTAEVVRQWRALRPQQVTELNTNRIGQARARAAALERAAGEFYITLDADDLLEPGMAEAGVAALAREPAAAVAAADVWMVDESGRRALRRLEQGRLPGWPGVLASNPLGGVAGLLARREAARRIGGLSVGLSGAEDWDFAVRLARAGLTVVRVPGALARYRQSADSFSRNPVPMLMARLELVERCRKPDPRLETPADRQPVLDERAARRYVNCSVFQVLGVAAAARPESIPEILAQYRAGDPEPAAWSSAFASGVSHGGLCRAIPAEVVERVRLPLERMLETAGEGPTAAGLHRALARAVRRVGFRGPRYFIRQWEAWRATRRFAREGGAA